MSDQNQELIQLAAMAYGESSSKNLYEEMAGIAYVLVRQRDARGYADMETFVNNEKTFSYVVSDGNERYTAFMEASSKDREDDDGMSVALRAAKNALDRGEDYSNGAYFWDGADIKKNYSWHFKVKHGIHFTDASHNIYGLKESTKVIVINKIVVRKRGKEKITETVEVGRYDHVYDSTAAYGGTIFWKQNPDYLKLTKAKEYK